MIAVVEQFLRQGEPLFAYNAVQDGLRAWPGNLRMRQLRGLAVARSGDTERANELLCELAAEGVADAETLGMLARTHKDLALASRSAPDRASHLASAFRTYSLAYEAACINEALGDASYTGINAAMIAVLQGDLAMARRLAREVRELGTRALHRARAAATDDYWLEATLGEAALILGDTGESAAHYARAASLAPGRFGDLGITRRQAELLAERLPGCGAWISEVLRVPPVLMYTGMPRLAPEQEEEVAAAIRTRLEILRPAAAYGTASCDSDILCLEALGRLGGETHIVLPFPAEDLRRLRIDLSRGEWGERFERVLAAANSVTVTSDHRARGSAATFEYASLVVTGMARLRARLLRTDLRGISIGGGGPTASDGGASSLLRIWRSQDVDIEQVPTVAPRRDAAESTGGAAPASGAAIPADEEVVGLGERLPDGFAHEIRAMLFADAVGYSALSEDQTPNFVTQFLGAVADLNARSAQRPEHVETTGDGLYMVFGGVRDAGDYALQLNRLVSGTDWAARGLPGGLSIRIALHCGPVYCGHNPLTGAPLYTGPHTSRTARIEPITPPGQVYASSAFAAVAAATGVEGLEMRYIGRMPLAKGYGLLGLYHVRSVAGPRTSAADGVAAPQGSAVSADCYASGVP